MKIEAKSKFCFCLQMKLPNEEIFRNAITSEITQLSSKYSDIIPEEKSDTQHLYSVNYPFGSFTYDLYFSIKTAQNTESQRSDIETKLSNLEKQAQAEPDLLRKKLLESQIIQIKSSLPEVLEKPSDPVFYLRSEYKPFQQVSEQRFYNIIQEIPHNPLLEKIYNNLSKDEFIAVCGEFLFSNQTTKFRYKSLTGKMIRTNRSFRKNFGEANLESFGLVLTESPYHIYKLSLGFQETTISVKVTVILPKDVIDTNFEDLFKYVFEVAKLQIEEV